jgi:hypothetical protein
MIPEFTRKIVDYTEKNRWTKQAQAAAVDQAGYLYSDYMASAHPSALAFASAGGVAWNMFNFLKFGMVPSYAPYRADKVNPWTGSYPTVTK